MPSRRVGLIGVVGSALLLVVPVRTAQEPQRTQVAPETVRAVLVDVVVRDKRGQPIRDLSAADFEVLEDGVRQNVGSFAPMFERPASTDRDGTAISSPPVSGVPNIISRAASAPGVTALVFDRLRPEARRIAAQAARAYLGSKEESADFVAVFGIDLSLTAFVPFTRNAPALRRALDAMVTSASSGYTSPQAQQAIADATQQATAANANPGGFGATPSVNNTAGAALLTEMQASMLRDFERMEHEQQGYATTNGLFAIINTLARIPGRKSLVLFSEGIAVPDQVLRLFLGVIDAANRASVSIYTMDAVGLRAESDQAKIRDAINQSAGAGIANYAADGGGDPYTRTLEGNEYYLRSDPIYSLGGLASNTGGLFFNNANDLRPAFERVESDRRNYYLLGYTPSNTKYDGRFRKIEVRVTRDNVAVAARKGYFAVRDPGGPINEWVAPALAALERSGAENSFPIRAGAMLFPERGRPGLVPVVVELKTAPLTFQPTADGKSYASDFTVLVRFVEQRDQREETVRTVSQHYEIRGPIGEIDRARLGEVIFYRESELPPGLYTMEAIVHDAPSGKSSVRLSTVEVAREDTAKLRMSSLVLVKRGEKVAAGDRPGNNPLLVKDVLIHPNLGETVSKSAKEVGFYFAAYPDSNGPAAEAAIELLQNGQRVAQLPMPAAIADRWGRVQHVGRLPIDQLAAGTYELRAVVKQAGERMVRSTMLRLAD
jgi:VWFA-related protein